MTLYEKILQRQDELDFNDEQLKKDFLEILPHIINYLGQSERLKADLEDILLTDMFDNLSFRLENDEEFSKHGVSLGVYGLFSPGHEQVRILYYNNYKEDNNSDSKHTISVRKGRNNKAILSHEFVHFLKYEIARRYNIKDCQEWIDEIMTELTSSNIVREIYGYDGPTKLAKQFVEAFGKFNLDEFFYNNMQNYCEENPAFKEMQQVFYDYKEDKFDSNAALCYVMANLLGTKFKECASSGEKLSQILKQVADFEFNNEFSSCYHDSEYITNLYVRAIRAFVSNRHLEIVAGQEDIEKLQQVVNNYRQSRSMEKQGFDANLIKEICVEDKKYYIVNFGKGNFRAETNFLRATMPKDATANLELINSIELGEVELSMSIDYSRPRSDVQIAVEGGVVLGFDKNSGKISVLKNPQKKKISINQFYSSEKAYDKLKQSIEECLVEKERESKIDFLKIRGESSALENKDNVRSIAQEVNMVADYLGSDIYVCDKERMFVSGMGEDAALMVGLRDSGFTPKVVSQIKRLDGATMQKCLEDLSLGRHEEGPLFLRTQDGEFIDIGGIYESGTKEKASPTLYYKRNNVWELLSDDLRQKIIRERIGEQRTSRIHDEL